MKVHSRQSWNDYCMVEGLTWEPRDGKVPPVLD